ncbi:MAG: two-component system sensor histidine kinase NtrB [Promethearchaeota archaeon]
MEGKSGKRKNFEQFITEMSYSFRIQDLSKFKSNFLKILEKLGLFLDVEQIFIVEINPNDDDLSVKYKWNKENENHFENEICKLKYSHFLKVKENLLNNQYFNLSNRTRSKEFQEEINLLNSCQLKNMSIFPLHDKNDIFGLLFFTTTKEKPIFKDSEINQLKMLSFIFTFILLQKKAEIEKNKSEIEKRRKENRLQKEIETQQLFYKETLELASEMIIRTDEKVRLTLVNKQILDTLGYSREEILNHKAFDFISKKYHKLVREKIQQKLIGLSTETYYEVELIKKNGDLIPIEINSRLLFKQDHSFHILAIMRDLTERHKIDSERIRQQKIESISLLAGGIAHDFNNIMVSILGNVNLLQMELLSTEQNEILKDLENATFQARDITKQLLLFSKGGNPAKKLESIEGIIHQSASFVLRGSKSKCDFDIEPNLPSLYIDAGQISQVLNNLIINASQAMRKGGK